MAAFMGFPNFAMLLLVIIGSCVWNCNGRSKFSMTDYSGGKRKLSCEMCDSCSHSEFEGYLSRVFFPIQ